MKKIAIFYTLAGGGHISLACSAKDAISQNYPNAQIILFDPFPESFSTTHKNLINHFLDLYRVGYKVTENPQIEPTIRRLTDLALTTQLVKFCQKNKPHILLTNHPLIATILPNVLDKLDFNPKTVVHFADPFTTHQSWFFNKQADLYLSPTLEMTQTAIKSGISKSKIKTIGWLLRQQFYSPVPNSRQIKQVLGLDQNKFTIFIGGTGQGSSDTITLCEQLLSASHKYPLQIIANPGLNQSLVNELLLLAKKYPDTLTLIPYTQNIPQLLTCSDLVVGKAGPNFMFETLHLGKPLLVTSYLPGQENGNIDFLRKYELGWIQLTTRSATQKITNLIQNPSTLTSKKSFIKKYIASPKKFVHELTRLLE